MNKQVHNLSMIHGYVFIKWFLILVFSKRGGVRIKNEQKYLIAPHRPPIPVIKWLHVL